jgi:hypothetical protein
VTGLLRDNSVSATGRTVPLDWAAIAIDPLIIVARP